MKTFRKKIISLFEKIRRPIYYQKVLVYSFDISKYNKMFKAKIPLRISHASVSEINKLHQNPAMNLKLYCSWDFLREKIEKGTWKCVVAKFKKKVIGYSFYSTCEMSFVGAKKIEFDLPPRTAYQFRMFVHPEFRNLLIGKELFDFRFRTLKKLGFVMTFNAVNSTNGPQIHNNHKIGGTFVGSFVFVKTKFFNKVFIPKSINKAGLKIKRIYTL